MKTVLIGSQDVLAWSVSKLTENDIPMSHVFYHERDADRRTNNIDLSAWFLAKRIPSTRVDEKQISDLWRQMKAQSPDILLSVYNRHRVPDDVLRSCGNAINFHPSLLPLRRGPIPTFWALLEGAKKTGVTAHFMTSAFDRGDIIFQTAFGIEESDTGYTLQRKAMRHTVDLVYRVVHELGTNRQLPRVPQDEALATIARPWRENMRKIDWNTKAFFISNQVRALTKPYSGALSDRPKEGGIVWSVKIGEKLNRHEAPGLVKEKEGNFIQVAASDRWVTINEFEA